MIICLFFIEVMYVIEESIKLKLFSFNIFEINGLYLNKMFYFFFFVY